MSKIGRKPIDIGAAKVEIKGQEIHFSGKNGSGVHTLPDVLEAKLDGKQLVLKAKNMSREAKRVWGLHRALVANKLRGVQANFEKLIQIEGLGFKAAVSGSKVVFTLGYSHKIDYELPKGVTLEVDKTGQNLTFKSADKELVGHVCSLVKSLRPTEPYKGTGIKLSTDVTLRKVGKTKSSA